MKIACEKLAMLNAINIVQKAIPIRTTYPILEGILIKTCEEQIKLVTNNLEMSIECKIDAKVIEKGEVVVDSKLLWEIIKRMPDYEIYIEEKNENVTIKCDKSLFEIRGRRGESFPVLPEIEKEIELKVPQIMLKDMIRQTIFAVGEDENRKILTGVNINIKDGFLVFVALDGFRLALKKLKIQEDLNDISIVIPGKTLNEIGKILDVKEEAVSVYFEKKQVMFDMGNTRIVSRLLEGDYINYENVIPEEFESRIRINNKTFLEAIERASILAISENMSYPIIIKLDFDKIIITANTPSGNAREEIENEILGNEMDIRFNPRYFIDALKVIDEEYVDVLFNSDIGPCIIKSADKDAFLYMILPLRK